MTALGNLLVLQRKLDNITLKKEFILDFLVKMILLKMVLLNVQMKLDGTLLKQFKSTLNCLNNFGIILKNLQVL